MKKRIIIILLAVATLLAGALAAGWFYATHQLARLEAYRNEITSALQDALGRNVAYEKAHASLTLRAGLSLQLDGLVIREKDNSSDWVSVESAFFRVGILPLMIGRVTLREVILDHPRVAISRDREGVFNIGDLLASDAQSKISLMIRKLVVDRGEIVFTDRAAGGDGRVTSFSQLSCRIEPHRWGRPYRIRLDTVMGEGKNDARLSIAGSFTPPSAGDPFSESAFNVTARLTGTDVDHWSPYLKMITPFSELSGRLDMETTLSGRPDHFTARGGITWIKPVLGYPGVFVRPLRPERLEMQYTAKRDGGSFLMDIPRLTADGFSVAARVDLRELASDDPYLVIDASSSALSRGDVASYVPWALIGEDITGFVDEHVPAGTFRLLELKLAGSISRINDMSSPGNEGVLYLQVQADQGVFTVNDDTPSFHDIRGTLELKDRSFHLKGMSARFGQSPCTLDGSISDFAMPGPSVYTAHGRFEPARSEVHWLLGKERISGIDFDGKTTIHLSGKGPADRFEIEADWDLTGAAFAYPGLVEKPASRSSRLTARMVLDEKSLNVTDFEYELLPLTISGSVSFDFDGKTPALLRVRARSLGLADLATMIPGIRGVHPEGILHADFTGRGNLADPGSLRWNGHASFSGVSLKPIEQARAIEGLTGTLTFKGTRLETSRVSGRFGQADVSGSCFVGQLHQPEITCRFESPRLFAADAGLEGEDVVFQNVKGQMALGFDRLRLDRVSLKTGGSVLNLKGEFVFKEKPEINIFVRSPRIDFEDISRLAGLKLPGGKDDPVDGIRLTAKVRVGKLVLERMEMADLVSMFTFEDSRLTVETLEAGVMEGRLKASGVIHLPPEGPARSETAFSLEGASLEQIQHFLDIGDRVITGRLSLSGDLVAEGADIEALKKSATGSIALNAQKGVLKKFSVLSKIFSILNVSQLLKFKLPDMVKDGMPYTAITANLKLDEGVLTSQDSLINSNAMQISAVGKVDFVKEEIDAIVGVHPLQTIDRIAARIPVAGWLLTDEKGRLITVHFKVDQTWDNPRVSAIPAQSLATGTLNIFRRIFSLPEKLVTDTGDVLLGR
jgi:uncharacterized protein YhdP